MKASCVCMQMCRGVEVQRGRGSLGGEWIRDEKQRHNTTHHTKNMSKTDIKKSNRTIVKIFIKQYVDVPTL